MTNPRRDHLCTSISGGRLVVASGGVLNGILNDIEIFDPAVDNGMGGWYSMGELPRDEYHNGTIHGNDYHGYADKSDNPNPRIQWIKEGQQCVRKLQWHND